MQTDHCCAVVMTHACGGRLMDARRVMAALAGKWSSVRNDLGGDAVNRVKRGADHSERGRCSSRKERQAIRNRQRLQVDCARRKFEYVPGSIVAKRSTAGLNPCFGTGNSKAFTQEKNIDRVTHTDGMNAADVQQEQAFARLQRWAKQQAAESLVSMLREPGSMAQRL